MQIGILAVTAGEVFTYIGYVIVALLALMIMIVVHELGHYTAGRLLGFKIDEFAIGFGPAIFKRKIKKTGVLFTIRPFPIGGFCSFHGEDAEGALLDEKGERVLDENGKIVKDPEAFNNQKPWKRLIVLFAGAFMNFVSAIVIITIYFAAYGQPLPNVVGVYKNSNAESVFEVGDVILNINGKQVNIVSDEDITGAFSGLGDTAKFKVLRNGKRISFSASKFYYSPFEKGDFITHVNGEELAHPIMYSQLSELSEADTDSAISLTVVNYDDEGNIVGSSNVTVQKGANPDDAEGFYSYGFGITRSLARTKLPFFLAFGRSFGFCFFIVFKILASLGALITGKIGAEAAGGTLTTIGVMAKVSSLGFDSFLYVVAVISANLAVMNLLPFPALDGSRMLFTLIEMIFRKPVPRKVEAVIHTVGLILLIVLAVFLDIFHLVKT
ncbi:MAG: RIP metalloprotease RseP [Bacteroides sp.]|nr:RIP metalloprotease RseP [Bacillota bacterium]MCM1455798.1 RIP metalloprotease RseP [Bacteroides sp.]